jgi:magnesium-transporting ATPase (P-type)
MTQKGFSKKGFSKIIIINSIHSFIVFLFQYLLYYIIISLKLLR